jgi:hypothetical protein
MSQFLSQMAASLRWTSPPMPRTPSCSSTASSTFVPDATPFVRGDSNADLSIDISDASATLGYLFLGSEAPRCLDAADATMTRAIELSEHPVRTLQHLFLGGTTLPPPFPFSGLDPTPDSLGCR